jgi:hypothetical protein
MSQADYLNEMGISLQFIQSKLKKTYPKSFFKDIDDISIDSLNDRIADESKSQISDNKKLSKNNTNNNKNQ